MVDAGLAKHLQRAFGRDTGVAVLLIPGYSAAVLEALERGEIDASMTTAPELEIKLEKQGLAHDRRQLALGDFVVVGPVEGSGRKAKDSAGVLGDRDIAIALNKIAVTQTRFIAPVTGSGAHLGSLRLWAAAKVSPAAPWYAESKGSALEQAIAEKAYTVVERSTWLAKGRKPLAIVCEGDPRMADEVHLMRSFRINHPAAKLFGDWVTSSAGRRAVGAVRGWRGVSR